MFQRVYLAAFLITSLGLAAAQQSSAPGKPLPPGAMQAKVKAACTQCHNTGRITEQHMTLAQWSKELEKMEGLGASIPDEQRKPMLQYLARNFGPKKGAAKAAVKQPGNGSY